MSDSFINPFHFVPLTEAKDTSKAEEVREAFEKNSGDAKHLSHAQYSAKTFSGTIECKLTTMSPCVFGNRHRAIPIDASQADKKSRGEEHDSTTIVENLSLGGKAAIAASSIKGMLSTLVEMASGSAMRVLNNRVLSQRSQMFGSRSAIGMIVGEQGQRKLVPLSLPTFKKSRNNSDYQPSDTSTTNEIWFKLVALRNENVSESRMTSCYVEMKKTDCFSMSKFPRVMAIGVDSPQIAWDQEKRLPKQQQSNDLVKTEDRPNRPESYLLRPAKIGKQNSNGHPHLNLPVVVNFDPDKDELLPGIVRSFYKEQGKQRTYPDRRKTAWSQFAQFLFIPRDWITDGLISFAKIPHSVMLNAEVACKNFDRIVTDHLSSAPANAAANHLPGQHEFVLPKKKGDKCGNTGLKQGDLVCFRPRWVDEYRKEEIEVESVSISSIWRDGPRVLWDSKSRQVDLLDSWERVPMQPGRNTVTMAEKLLGWVDQAEIKIEEQEKDHGKQLDVMSAYKGRIRVSDALCFDSLDKCQEINSKAEDWSGLNPEVSAYFPLQILGSPRPPCAEFYLHKKGQNAYIDFAKSAEIKIQGWKFYWRHGDASISKAKTKVRAREKKSWKQKCWVKPIRPGVDFTFSIRFDNLTENEFDLLCYALCPNSDERDEKRQFLHSIGFAKPLGFGTVKIAIERVRLIDRAKRYGSEEDLLKAVSTQAVEQSDKEQDMTQIEFSEGAKRHAERIGKLHNVICLMGRPVTNGTPIIYPTCCDQDNESELFEWFSANRHKDREKLHLKPLTGDETDVRLSLDRHQKIQRRN